MQRIEIVVGGGPSDGAPDGRRIYIAEFSGVVEFISVAADHLARGNQIHAADRPGQHGAVARISD